MSSDCTNNIGKSSHSEFCLKLNYVYTTRQCDEYLNYLEELRDIIFGRKRTMFTESTIHYHTRTGRTLVYDLEDVSNYGIKLSPTPSQNESRQLPTKIEERLQNCLNTSSEVISDLQFAEPIPNFVPEFSEEMCDYGEEELAEIVDEAFAVTEEFGTVLEESGSVFEEVGSYTEEVEEYEVTDEEVQDAIRRAFESKSPKVEDFQQPEQPEASNSELMSMIHDYVEMVMRAPREEPEDDDIHVSEYDNAESHVNQPENGGQTAIVIKDIISLLSNVQLEKISELVVVDKESKCDHELQNVGVGSEKDNEEQHQEESKLSELEYEGAVPQTEAPEFVGSKLLAVTESSNSTLPSDSPPSLPLLSNLPKRFLDVLSDSDVISDENSLDYSVQLKSKHDVLEFSTLSGDSQEFSCPDSDKIFAAVSLSLFEVGPRYDSNFVVEGYQEGATLEDQSTTSEQLPVISCSQTEDHGENADAADSYATDDQQNFPEQTWKLEWNSTTEVEGVTETLLDVINATGVAEQGANIPDTLDQLESPVLETADIAFSNPIEVSEIAESLPGKVFNDFPLAEQLDINIFAPPLRDDPSPLDFHDVDNEESENQSKTITTKTDFESSDSVQHSEDQSAVAEKLLTSEFSDEFSNFPNEDQFATCENCPSISQFFSETINPTDASQAEGFDEDQLDLCKEVLPTFQNTSETVDHNVEEVVGEDVHNTIEVDCFTTVINSSEMASSENFENAEIDGENSEDFDTPIVFEVGMTHSNQLAECYSVDEKEQLISESDEQNFAVCDASYESVSSENFYDVEGVSEKAVHDSTGVFPFVIDNHVESDVADHVAEDVDTGSDQFDGLDSDFETERSIQLAKPENSDNLAPADAEVTKFSDKLNYEVFDDDHQVHGEQNTSDEQNFSKSPQDDTKLSYDPSSLQEKVFDEDLLAFSKENLSTSESVQKIVDHKVEGVSEKATHASNEVDCSPFAIDYQEVPGSENVEQAVFDRVEAEDVGLVLSPQVSSISQTAPKIVNQVEDISGTAVHDLNKKECSPFAIDDLEVSISDNFVDRVEADNINIGSDKLDSLNSDFEMGSSTQLTETDISENLAPAYAEVTKSEPNSEVFDDDNLAHCKEDPSETQSFAEAVDWIVEPEKLDLSRTASEIVDQKMEDFFKEEVLDSNEVACFPSAIDDQEVSYVESDRVETEDLDIGSYHSEDFDSDAEAKNSIPLVELVPDNPEKWLTSEYCDVLEPENPDPEEVFDGDRGEDQSTSQNSSEIFKQVNTEETSPESADGFDKSVCEENLLALETTSEYVVEEITPVSEFSRVFKIDVQQLTEMECSSTVMNSSEVSSLGNFGIAPDIKYPTDSVDSNFEAISLLPLVPVKPETSSSENDDVLHLECEGGVNVEDALQSNFEEKLVLCEEDLLSSHSSCPVDLAETSISEIFELEVPQLLEVSSLENSKKLEVSQTESHDSIEVNSLDMASTEKFDNANENFLSEKDDEVASADQFPTPNNYESTSEVFHQDPVVVDEEEMWASPVTVVQRVQAEEEHFGEAEFHAESTVLETSQQVDESIELSRSDYFGETDFEMENPKSFEAESTKKLGEAVDNLNDFIQEYVNFADIFVDKMFTDVFGAINSRTSITSVEDSDNFYSTTEPVECNLEQADAHCSSENLQERPMTEILEEKSSEDVEEDFVTRTFLETNTDNVYPDSERTDNFETDQNTSQEHVSESGALDSDNIHEVPDYSSFVDRFLSEIFEEVFNIFGHGDELYLEPRSSSFSDRQLPISENHHNINIDSTSANSESSHGTSESTSSDLEKQQLPSFPIQTETVSANNLDVAINQTKIGSVEVFQSESTNVEVIKEVLSTEQANLESELYGNTPRYCNNFTDSERYQIGTFIDELVAAVFNYHRCVAVDETIGETVIVGHSVPPRFENEVEFYSPSFESVPISTSPANSENVIDETNGSETSENFTCLGSVIKISEETSENNSDNLDSASTPISSDVFDSAEYVLSEETEPEVTMENELDNHQQVLDSGSAVEQNSVKSEIQDPTQTFQPEQSDNKDSIQHQEFNSDNLASLEIVAKDETSSHLDFSEQQETTRSTEVLERPFSTDVASTNGESVIESISVSECLIVAEFGSEPLEPVITTMSEFVVDDVNPEIELQSSEAHVVDFETEASDSRSPTSFFLANMTRTEQDWHWAPKQEENARSMVLNDASTSELVADSSICSVCTEAEVPTEQETTSEPPPTSSVVEEVSYFLTTVCVAALALLSPSESNSFDTDIIEDASQYFSTPTDNHNE